MHVFPISPCNLFMAKKFLSIILLVLCLTYSISASLNSKSLHEKKRKIDDATPTDVYSINLNFEGLSLMPYPIRKKLPEMSSHNIAYSLDNSIYNANYDTFNYMHKLENFAPNYLVNDHLEGLIRQDGEDSDRILNSILNSNEIFCDEISENLSHYLKLAASKSFSKFRLLWLRFSGEFLNEKCLGEILETVAFYKAVRVYDFIKAKMLIQSEFEEIRSIALQNASNISRQSTIREFFNEMDERTN